MLIFLRGFGFWIAAKAMVFDFLNGGSGLLLVAGFGVLTDEFLNFDNWRLFSGVYSSLFCGVFWLMSFFEILARLNESYDDSFALLFFRTAN